MKRIIIVPNVKSVQQSPRAVVQVEQTRIEWGKAEPSRLVVLCPVPSNQHWKKILPLFLPRRGRGCPTLHTFTPPKKGGNIFTII